MTKEKLEKEIKTLGERCLQLQKDKGRLTDELTKAKEIIKKLYSHVFQGMDFMELNDYNVQKAEAEQFISEVEK